MNGIALCGRLRGCARVYTGGGLVFETSIASEIFWRAPAACHRLMVRSAGESLIGGSGSKGSGRLMSSSVCRFASSRDNSKSSSSTHMLTIESSAVLLFRLPSVVGDVSGSLVTQASSGDGCW
jgi:hypothetical protein